MHACDICSKKKSHQLLSVTTQFQILAQTGYPDLSFYGLLNPLDTCIIEKATTVPIHIFQIYHLYSLCHLIPCNLCS